MEINDKYGKNQIETGVKKYRLIRVCIKIPITCKNKTSKAETLRAENFGGILN